MSRPIHLTDANFEDEVLGSEIPVLVDFWASWCPPCKMVEPVVAELAEEFDGKVRVGKLNVDQNPWVAGRYDVLGVPTFIVFSSGDAREKRTGAQSKAQLIDLLRCVLTETKDADASISDATEQVIDEDEEEQVLARLRALGYAD